MRRIALPLAIFVLLSAQTQRSLYNEGIRAAMQGNLRKASAALQRAAAEQPKEADGYYVHYWLGVVLSALGDGDGALKEWRESVRQGVSPDHTDVMQRIAVAEKKQEEPALSRAEHAERDARFLRARETPSFAKAIAATQQARTLQAQGKPEDAAKAAGDAVRLFQIAQAEPRTLETTSLPPPPPPPLPPPTGPDQAMFDEIDRRFAELSPGAVVFTAPDTMHSGDTSAVDLRIAAKGREGNILEDLPQGVTSTAVQEHITPVMEAHLDGGSGMDVQSLTKEVQSVAGGGFAEWRWNVTPKSAGKQRLTITISVHLTYPDGHVEAKTVRTMTRDVTVSANVSGSVKGFFASYWQWLTTTLIIPIVIFFYRKRSGSAAAKS